MRAWYPETVKGAGLGVFAFVLVSSSFPTHLALASSGPYFSMTLIAPTTDPARRQWAAIIQNSFEEANIDAKLIYTNFQTMIGLLFACSNGCPANDFAHGGWDATFVGNGATTALPDFGTQNAVFYRNEGLGDVPPNGGNYYFFRNGTFNSLADDYNSNFNINQWLADARKMVLVAAQERPGLIILYPAIIFAFSASLKPWGTTDATTISTAGLDWHHWNTGSMTSINVAAPPWSTNSLPTEAQFPNSNYERLLFGSTSAVLEEADSRGTGIYFNALAKNITSSPRP